MTSIAAKQASMLGQIREKVQEFIAMVREMIEKRLYC